MEYLEEDLRYASNPTERRKIQRKIDRLESEYYRIERMVKNAETIDGPRKTIVERLGAFLDTSISRNARMNSGARDLQDQLKDIEDRFL